MEHAAPRVGFLGFGEAGYHMAKGLAGVGLTGIVAYDKFATDAVNVYCTAGAVLGVTGDLTLDGLGNENAVFVFQSPAESMVTAGRVLLQNGAKAKNVYWVIGTSATLGVSSQIQGNILANISITLVDGATLLGRALAHTGAVTMGANNVINLP